MHSPAPNGIDLSNLTKNLPLVSRNRSGINNSGLSQIDLSLWLPYNEEKTIAPWKFEKKLKKKRDISDHVQAMCYNHAANKSFEQRIFIRVNEIYAIFRNENLIFSRSQLLDFLNL